LDNLHARPPLIILHPHGDYHARSAASARGGLAQW
jgi:hypothetical protein